MIPEALQSRLGTLSLEKQAKLEKDIAKAEKKAEKKADAAEKKKKVRTYATLFAGDSLIVFYCDRNRRFVKFSQPAGRDYAIKNFHKTFRSRSNESNAPSANTSRPFTGLKHLVCLICFGAFQAYRLILLPHTDIQLKPVAKYFAQRFATGASVTKNAQGQDEIVIQGDVADDILEMIEEGKVKLLKGVPPDNVEVVEDKKKKAAEEEE